MWHETTSYPSDMTDELWAVIGALDMNRPWGPGRPRRVELRAILNAIWHVLTPYPDGYDGQSAEGGCPCCPYRGARRCSNVLLRVPAALWCRLAKILADGGYGGAEFQVWAKTARAWSTWLRSAVCAGALLRLPHFLTRATTGMRNRGVLRRLASRRRSGSQNLPSMP